VIIPDDLAGVVDCGADAAGLAGGDAKINVAAIVVDEPLVVDESDAGDGIIISRDLTGVIDPGDDANVGLCRRGPRKIAEIRDAAVAISEAVIGTAAR